VWTQDESGRVAEKRLASGDSLRIVALVTVFIVVIAGASQAALDAREFDTVWDGVWSATVTFTTVGYGDLYPTTVEGRLIGAAVVFVGIGFLAVLTATIASKFVKDERGSETQEILAALRRIEADVARLNAADRAPLTD
jgi:voltage-gated potassium channel